MLNYSVRHRHSSYILNNSSASFSKRWILHDKNLCLGRCLQTRRQNTTTEELCFTYTKVSGWCVITTLLHVCCILLHHSLAFTHLKFVRLTFWQDKPFVCALLHRKKIIIKKNLDTEFSAKMPASATRWIVFFCYIFVRFSNVGPVLSEFRIYTVYIFIFQ